MTRSRYTFEEALNRILRTLEGKALAVDTPEVVTGELLNKENAASDLSELLDNSLPGETLTIPTAIINAVNSNLPAATTSVAGIAQLADVDEANAGTSQNTILTPEGHSWAHEFGGIYSTGTVSQTFAQDTWTKVTGTFQFAMNNSGSEVTCNYYNDRLVLNESGSYFVPYQVDLFCHGDAVRVQAKLFVDSVPSDLSLGYITLPASGSVAQLQGYGIVSVTGTVTAVDIRLAFAAGNDVTYKAARLAAFKQVG